MRAWGEPTNEAAGRGSLPRPCDRCGHGSPALPYYSHSLRGALPGHQHRCPEVQGRGLTSTARWLPAAQSEEQARTPHQGEAPISPALPLAPGAPCPPSAIDSSGKLAAILPRDALTALSFKATRVPCADPLHSCQAPPLCPSVLPSVLLSPRSASCVPTKQTASVQTSTQRTSVS